MSKLPKVTSLQYLYNKYLKEIIKDEVDFLPAYKHQSFLDFGNIILGLCGKTFLKYLKYQVVCYFCEIS